MDRGFFEYRFSRHFNHLTYLGVWSEESLKRPVLRKLHVIYRILLHFLIIVILTDEMLDLYTVFGDFEKVTFNFCSSILVIGVVLKIMLVCDRRRVVNELRVEFWQNFLELDAEEDISALDRAFRQLNFIYYSGYGVFISVILVILGFHYYAYLGGSGDLPFAALLPMKYPDALAFETFCAVYVALIALEDELVAFSLILQISAQHDILLNRIRRLDDICEKGKVDKITEESTEEKVSHGKKAKETIKYCVAMHLKLMEYTRKLEYVYSRCMVIQLLLGSIMILMNGLELCLFSQEFSLKICSQMLIIVVIVNDLLLLCYYNTKLASQFVELGNAAYSTAWYNMNDDTKMGLYMIMMGSRKPPQLTAGKMILVDLHTFMLAVRNIISWLMLIRELVNQGK